MKKSILFVFLLGILSAPLLAQQGQLPNIGFETWNTTSLYEDLDDWLTSNYIEGFPLINAIKSTSPNTGSFALRLENHIVQDDTIFGFAFLGSVGEDGPDGGVTYVSQVDLFTGFYKYNVAAGDTAVMVIIKYLAGSEASIDLIPITGSASTWTSFSFPINATNQDQVFIGLLASNPFNENNPGNPNTWVEFDDVGLSHSVLGAGVALPNPSFENWSDVTYMEPAGWHSFNALLAPFGVAAANQTTDAANGSFAVLCQGVDMGDGDVIPGAIFYGTLDDEFEIIPRPYNTNPGNLEFQYKYNPAVNDTAFVLVEFYKNGATVGQDFDILQSSASYQSMNITLNITGQPDSATVIFFSGDSADSELFIDDVQFSGGNTGTNEIVEIEFSVYPNPTSDFAFISLEEYSGKLELRNSLGQLVFEDRLEKLDEYSLDVSNYNAGTYLVILRNSEGSSVQRLIIE